MALYTMTVYNAMHICDIVYNNHTLFTIVDLQLYNGRKFKWHCTLPMSTMQRTSVTLYTTIMHSLPS